MSISTHILDTARGCPAAGVAVSLASYERMSGEWRLVHESETDSDGRAQRLLPETYRADGEPVLFRLRFTTGIYFAAQQTPSLYPYIDIVFKVEGSAHYHIPLLLTANSYTTYRGS